jgi:lipoprotein-releasing system permease protein
MQFRIPWMIGLRYTRAKRRNQFISFVSGFSLLGMALGVLALILVLSVMNGFDREIKQRLLQVVPHGFLVAKDPVKAPLLDWSSVAKDVQLHPQVTGAAPYIDGHGLIGYAGSVQGIEIRGVDPISEKSVSAVTEHMIAGDYHQLHPGSYGIVIGRLLARYLGVNVGDYVTLTLPQLTITPAGIFPRTKRFKLVGVFEVGAQVDQRLALIHLTDAQKLYRLNDAVHGIQIRVDNLYQAGSVVNDLVKPWQDNLRAVDWSQTQGSLFAAVKMEKTVIGVLLFIIVAVAAFNIISSLVLMVADKRTDIAVLRTMGLNRGQVMGIFIVQGAWVGVLGILIGAVIGSLLALVIGDLVVLIERLTGLRIFDPNVYFISHLPSQLQWQDVTIVCGAGVFMSLLSTLYPAYRAAKIEPAEALRYE